MKNVKKGQIWHPTLKPVEYFINTRVYILEVLNDIVYYTGRKDWYDKYQKGKRIRQISNKVNHFLGMYEYVGEVES